MKDKSLEDILNRSVAEQILAVEKIWDSIAEQSENLKPSQDQLDLVKERLEHYKKNPTLKRSWEEFKGDFLKS